MRLLHDSDKWSSKNKIGQSMAINDVNNILYLLLKKVKIKKKHKIFNICSSSPQKITTILKLLDKNFKKPFIKKLPLQKATILKTNV